MKCSAASIKLEQAGAWWAVEWKPEDLVTWREGLYIPYDFRFGFKAGKPMNIAVIHDLRSNTEYHAPLSDVIEIHNGEDNQ